MMRGPGNWAVAVRTPSGEIAQVSRSIDSQMARHRVLRLPIIRGVMALGESLAIGFRALAISANYAAQEEGDEGEPSTELSRGALIFAFAIAIGFAVMLFKVTPGLLTELLPIKGTGWFVIVEGLIRVSIFVAYLSLISLLPDLRRVFQYHAAEHKAINAYEAGEELEPEVVQRYSLIHPRCGTAFMLWVMVLAVFVFAFFGRPPAAVDRGPRLRADPLRGEAPGQPRADDAARAGHVAAAADDASALARPARSLDPRPARSAAARGRPQPRRQARRSHGLTGRVTKPSRLSNGV